MMRTSPYEKNMKRWRRSTWHILLNLNAPTLVPPAVQFAVFDEDPVPGFRNRVKARREYNQKSIEEAKEAGKERIAHSVAMRRAWDSGFEAVTGDDVSLLVSAPSIFQGISSSGPDGRKWIVTKTVQIEKEPVCWYLPVDVKVGKETKVTLSEKNMFDLESAFERAMLEPNRQE